MLRTYIGPFPVIITIQSQILNKENKLSLHNNKTDWALFREKLDTLSKPNQPLKTEHDIDTAVVNVTRNIQQAALFAASILQTTQGQKKKSLSIKQKLEIKRKLRKQWQQTRTPENKKKN